MQTQADPRTYLVNPLSQNSRFGFSQRPLSREKSECDGAGYPVSSSGFHGGFPCTCMHMFVYAHSHTIKITLPLWGPTAFHNNLCPHQAIAP